MRRQNIPSIRRFAPVLALAGLAMALSACAGGSGGRLPPVFGAVFGMEGAETYPFVAGRVPEVGVERGDRLIGEAAGQPGQCIYADDGTARRFRAACPEGFDL